MQVRPSGWRVEQRRTVVDESAGMLLKERAPQIKHSKT
jgi:hypothetical protein